MLASVRLTPRTPQTQLSYWTMPRYRRVAIIGVGLIGGSIGGDLLRRGLADEVVGIGRRAESLALAQQLKLITRGTTDLAEGVTGAELIVVCTPVERIVADALAAAQATQGDMLITDAGSTKGSIVQALEDARRQGKFPAGVRFVGSHPMAGSEKSGPAAATHDLFVDRVAIVTPTEQTSAADVAAVVDFWSALGARVVSMSPDEHDRAVAIISHLPHLAAAALAAVTSEAERGLAAGGWRDTTRIAAADPLLWRQILLDNRSCVLTALGHYEKVLASFRAALEHADPATLDHLLQEAKLSRDALGS